MFFEILSEYQTLIVGALGFGGVALTLIVNERRSLEIQKQPMVEKRNAVQLALKEELKGLLAAVSAMINTTSENDVSENSKLILQVWRSTPMFDAYVKDLGALDTEQIEAVLAAYRSFSEANVLLEITSIEAKTAHTVVIDKSNLVRLTPHLELTRSAMKRACSAL